MGVLEQLDHQNATKPRKFSIFDQAFREFVAFFREPQRYSDIIAKFGAVAPNYIAYLKRHGYCVVNKLGTRGRKNIYHVTDEGYKRFVMLVQPHPTRAGVWTNLHPQLCPNCGRERQCGYHVGPEHYELDFCNKYCADDYEEKYEL
jgi:hypothetical protein